MFYYMAKSNKATGLRRTSVKRDINHSQHLVKPVAKYYNILYLYCLDI